MADQYRSRGIPEDWVTLEHPQVEGTQTVHPRAMKHWEARGWKVADPKPDHDPVGDSIEEGRRAAEGLLATARPSASPQATKKAPAAPVRPAGGSEG